MSLSIQSNEDILTRLTMILWGESKAGKTTYAMSAPGRKLILNFDPDGYTSVMNRDDFDVIDLAQYTGKECIENGKKAVAMIKNVHEKYDTVILDSLTTLTSQSLRCAIENRIGSSNKFTPTLEVPGLSAWGARNTYTNDIVERLLRITAQYKLHCILMAHTDDPEYDSDGKTAIRQTMMLSGKIKNQACLRASEIWNLTSSNTGRKIYTAPHGIRAPMGSRIFDTEKVKSFILKYDPNKPDIEQESSIATLFNKWSNNGKSRLTVAPN